MGLTEDMIDYIEIKNRIEKFNKILIDRCIHILKIKNEVMCEVLNYGVTCPDSIEWNSKHVVMLPDSVQLNMNHYSEEDMLFNEFISETIPLSILNRGDHIIKEHYIKEVMKQKYESDRKLSHIKDLADALGYELVRKK